ncbi:XrtA/PEP-CTERM system-associated ATPase [Yunchengibacter salinarum]|uniref:XrtA/PEP-CTERM system-associated ATPase n=1 Tax=Yunchengibacter salinarum TaxID=3133399 RepID=UPI0035B6301C
MFEEVYNLSGRPFQLTPDPRFFFGSKTHKKAMAYLTYGLSQGEGFIIVTGGIGTGKTTLVRHLFETLDRREFVAAMIVSTQLNAEDLLRSVVAAFGLDSTKAADKGALLSMLENYLREQARAGRRALLVVDEAQNLSNAALEEMRMLSNYQENNMALLQSFLVGQPEFRDRVFSAPELEQFRQRVIATHHLEAMDPEEVADYIEHRLRLVDWDDDPTFTPEAVEAIYDFSGGVPRRLNALCSRILLFGALEDIHEIDQGVVATVIEDMAEEVRPVGEQASPSAQASKSRDDGPVNPYNDGTVPLERAPRRETLGIGRGGGNRDDQDEKQGRISEMEGRIGDLESTLRRQSETLDKLTQLMGRLADEKDDS